MIPIRLSLRNFMCYRENVPPLDFTGIHTACISGDNGNGKSALIDAMTWALWGRSRAIRSDDDLINLLADEMEVEFEFAIGGQGYRIIRKHARPKKRARSGQSLLELQAASADGFRSISGDSIPLTQQKIISVLHMDYDTFINSAYLRQGHADEFATRRPVERKQVLADILGLSVYDEMETKARELARSLDDDTNRVQTAIEEIDREMTRRPVFEADLAAAQASLSDINAAAYAKETALEDLRSRKEALQQKKTQVDEMETRAAQAERDLKAWEGQTAEHLTRIARYEAVIIRRAEIETGYTGFSNVKKSGEEMDSRSRQATRLEGQRTQLEKFVAGARNDLTAEHTATSREIGWLEAREAALPELRGELREVQAHLHRLEDAESEAGRREQAAQEAHTEITRLESEAARLEKEIKETAEKLDIIASHIAAHTGTRCPLCETALTLEGLELIQSKYVKEKTEKEGALRTSRESLAAREAAYKMTQYERTLRQAKLNAEKNSVHAQTGALNRQIAEIEEEAKRLASLHEARSAVETRLATRDYAANEQQALAAIETELAALGYDTERHEELRRQVKTLEPFEKEKQALDEALRFIDAEKQSLEKARAEAQARREAISSDLTRRQALSDELVRLPEVLRALASTEAEYKEIGVRRSRAQEALGSVKAQLQRLEGLEIAKKEKETQQAQAREEAGTYLELARAFGKSGIQALLIEAALPEIEIEANRLLSRMTDNRMHVKIETQRLTRKGDTQETLDITIADELGTRPYETYSGGEAFRINFAVRIALSRLLVHRAGAPLPTLIIDEGFGTLDVTGIEKITAAINSIQGEFEKILVITHIEELRDAFPARIDVVKTPAGATLTVS
jgi:DNA repair protein SbcC/Rad50